MSISKTTIVPTIDMRYRMQDELNQESSTQHAQVLKERLTACEKEVTIHNSSGGGVPQVRKLCMGMKASLYYSQTLREPLPQFPPKYLRIWLPKRAK